MTPCTRPARQLRRVSFLAAALLCCAPSEVLEKLHSRRTTTSSTGIEIVTKALSRPARQIASTRARMAQWSSARSWKRTQYAYGFDAQTGEYGNLVEGHHRPDQGCAGGAAGRGRDRWSADYHGSHGGRKAEEGDSYAGHAGRWHGRNGRHGLLSPPSTGRQRPGIFSGPFSPSRSQCVRRNSG